MNKSQAEPPQAAGTSPLKILALLTESDQQRLAMAELLRACRMSISDFAKAIESFREAGLITLSGPAGEEVVQLSESGAHIAKIS